MSERARVLDAQARARAQLEFDRPLVVEAGAGTGKTAVLTSRLVAWSLGPGWERSALRSTEAGSDATPPAIARDVLGRSDIASTSPSSQFTVFTNRSRLR